MSSPGTAKNLLTDLYRKCPVNGEIQSRQDDWPFVLRRADGGVNKRNIAVKRKMLEKLLIVYSKICHTEKALLKIYLKNMRSHRTLV